MVIEHSPIVDMQDPARDVHLRVNWQQPSMKLLTSSRSLGGDGTGGKIPPTFPSSVQEAYTYSPDIHQGGQALLRQILQAGDIHQRVDFNHLLYPFQFKFKHAVI